MEKLYSTTVQLCCIFIHDYRSLRLEGKTKIAIEILRNSPIGGGGLRHHCTINTVTDSFLFAKGNNKKYGIILLDDTICGIVLEFGKGGGGRTFEKTSFNLIVQHLLVGVFLIYHVCLKGRNGLGNSGDQSCILCHHLLILVKERGNGWVNRGANIS